LVLTACKPGTPRSGEAKGAASETPQSVPQGVPKAAVEKAAPDIGDVESSLEMRATLSEKSRAANIAVDQMVDARDRLDLVTLAVSPPRPKELWVSFLVRAKGELPKQPVALRGKVFRDKVVIASFSTLVSAALAEKAYEQAVDVLAGLPAAPETLLVSGQAEVFFLPPGTDPATADLSALPATPQTTGNVLSNPVRIDFKAEGGKP
jgi:hypothetical protein